MAGKTEMIDKTQDHRWVCGRKHDGTFILVELRGRMTGCYFFIDTKWDDGKSYREAREFLEYSPRPRNNSPKLHVRREGAVQAMFEQLTAEQARCQRRSDEITAELEKVSALI